MPCFVDSVGFGDADDSAPLKGFCIQINFGSASVKVGNQFQTNGTVGDSQRQGGIGVAGILGSMPADGFLYWTQWEKQKRQLASFAANRNQFVVGESVSD
jgi:hypothetical protein